MSDAWRYAEITSFEHVSVGGKTALLRLNADASPQGGHEGPRPMLVADDGETVNRFVAIPAPADTDDELHAAYSVPSSLVTPDTVFFLEYDDEYVVSLPEPAAGASRVNRRADRPAAPAAAAAPVAEPEPATTEGDLDDQDDEPARTEDSAWDEDDAGEDDEPEGGEPEGGEPEGGEPEDRRIDMPRQFTALSAELADARRENGELRAVAEQAKQAGRETREALLHMHVVVAETNAELTAMRDLGEALGNAAAGPGESARTADLQRALAEAELVRDEAIAARTEAEESVAPLTEAREKAERQLEEAREEARQIALEREELDRQASAFDGVAIKARERATEAEAEAGRAGSRLAELETWSAELERRLADTTTQLGDARAKVESDELELRRLRGELAEAHAQAELDQAALRRAAVTPDAPAAPAASAAPTSAAVVAEPVAEAEPELVPVADPEPLVAVPEPEPEPEPLVQPASDTAEQTSIADDPDVDAEPVADTATTAATAATARPTLGQIGQAAVAEAHELAERDLADAGS